MVKSSNAKTKRFIDTRYMVTLWNSLAGNIFWSTYEKKKGVRVKTKGRCRRSLGSYFCGSQTMWLTWGLWLTPPPFRLEWRTKRNCQQRKPWSRGRGQNLNRFLISGNRAVFQENTGPLPRHTFTSPSMCPPIPIKIIHFSLWVFLMPWEINLLYFIDIINSCNI